MTKLKKGAQVYIELTQGENVSRHFMNVIDYNLQGYVMCYWYTKQGDFMKSDFPENLLFNAPSESPDFEQFQVFSL